MTSSILGSIMYLNSQEVDNLLDSIEGGLVDQFTESTKKTSGKEGSGGVDVPGFELKGDLNMASEELREGVRKQTPVSRLAALRRILTSSEESQLQFIDATSSDVRTGLSHRQLLAVHVSFNVSTFAHFFVCPVSR